MNLYVYIDIYSCKILLIKKILFSLLLKITFNKFGIKEYNLFNQSLSAFVC